MNKSTINTIVGILVIFAIIFGYSMLTAPSKEEKAAMQKKQDSMVRAAQEKARLDSISAYAVQKKNDSIAAARLALEKDTTARADSIRKEEQQVRVGAFALSSSGQNRYLTVENDLVKLRISSRGGFISQVELKDYKTYDQRPLILFDSDSTLTMNFYGSNNALYRTSSFFFQPYVEDKRFEGKDNIKISGDDSVVFCMRLYPDLNDSVVDKTRFIEYRYVLKGNNYMMDFSVNMENMNTVLTGNSNYLYFEWRADLQQQEKDHKTEHNSTTIYFMPKDDAVDYLSETGDDEKQFKVPMKWISFKQQFFLSTLIAKESFKEADIEVKTKTDTTDPLYLKSMFAQITLTLEPGSKQSFPMMLYFGPNKYKTLTKYDLDLERQIPLGWSFFLLQWINRFAVIPVFNWLETYGMNYGIIILLLTIMLKIVLFPIAYRTYKSSAKMRVLRPEVEEINKKFPKKEDAMKKQQATMALYKKAGVNPMAGCVPLLLQMPILIALYRFFPSSIELRQQSFLWAEDLSSYDSIASWDTYIPLLSDFYGNHISLFTLLMTITTIIYTWLNNQDRKSVV